MLTLSTIGGKNACPPNLSTKIEVGGSLGDGRKTGERRLGNTDVKCVTFLRFGLAVGEEWMFE